MKEKYRRAWDLISSSRRTLALTGAGISTLCGIPDFRTDQSGVWDRHDRETIFDIEYFKKNPGPFYDFAKEYIYAFGDILPGEAHLWLARLAEKGLLSAIATQNIDGLHQKAGSKTVYELHGHARSSHCLQCRRRYESGEVVEIMTRMAVPHCSCTGVIKPDVIFYGEPLPEDALESAYHEASRCDLLLVMGTSLAVYPAAYIPNIALNSRAHMIIMNVTSTSMDSHASLVIHDDLRDVCTAMLTLI
ncbi:MAG TPA: NAD-dependent protein deacylase [Candidatus Sumerlaeota bacterium]|nr:NAD-dependent protein deacylase [Candidatus Sumerlaeota bacterium]